MQKAYAIVHHNGHESVMTHKGLGSLEEAEERLKHHTQDGGASFNGQWEIIQYDRTTLAKRYQYMNWLWDSPKGALRESSISE